MLPGPNLQLKAAVIFPCARPRNRPMLLAAAQIGMGPVADDGLNGVSRRQLARGACYLTVASPTLSIKRAA